MKPSLDRYTIEARLLPVLLVFLPIGAVVFGLFPVDRLEWGIISGLLTSFGFTALLSQLGRDQGKKKEPLLYKKWGGAPTTLMLRYLGSKFKQVTLERYHKKLGTMLNLAIPSPELERTDSIKADNMYQSFVDFLKEKTRDKKSFPLVFAETVNYGFRRNLWGLKSIALVVASLAFVVSAISVYFQIRSSESISVSSLFSLSLNALLLIIWSCWINVGWVRVAADAYAQRLIASCENI
jgi:hypothetical protein